MKINLIELFEESVKKNPQKIAVIDKERTISFSDLRRNAISLAQKIVYKHVEQNRPVGVFLEKSIESVYADLGILYSGNFYMNLDVKTPAERIGNILKLTEPISIITSSNFFKLIISILIQKPFMIFVKVLIYQNVVQQKHIYLWDF